jgi:hypothetical protein
MLAPSDWERAQPRVVHSIEETGLPFGLVLDLVLKHAYFEGTVLLRTLVERTKLSPMIIHSIYRHLQKEQLCETRTMIGEDYEITLSTKGRIMADIALKRSQYAGPAPVRLTDYQRLISKQGIPFRVNEEGLKTVLSDLVLPTRVIHQLGTALVTGGAILLYGETGNGKTSIAERLNKIFDDQVFIPHAVEISGHVIGVFDPQIHVPLENQSSVADARGVLCRRPMVKVGGELTSEMLEPRVDEATRIGVAPIQMKANNGILLIDDFGRQRIAPRELLNRWIVPMDRRVDLLSLSGMSFEIPFEMLVIFATNLAVSDLAEDAFLRRLKNKIKVESLSPELFKELIRRACQHKGLPLTPEIEEYFLQQVSKNAKGQLRACFPTDLTAIVSGMATFEQRGSRLDKEDVDSAMAVYFAH